MDKREQRWRELCAQAAVEQDPEKLMQLVTEITRLLGKQQEGAEAKKQESLAKPEDSSKK
jgi:ribosomal protein S18